MSEALDIPNWTRIITCLAIAVLLLVLLDYTLLPCELEQVTATVRSDRELAELHSSWIPHDIVEEVTVEEEREKTQEKQPIWGQ